MTRLIISLELEEIDSHYKPCEINYIDFRNYILVAVIHIGVCVQLSPALESEYYALSAKMRHKIERIAEHMICYPSNLWCTLRLLCMPSSKLCKVRTNGKHKVEINYE